MTATLPSLTGSSRERRVRAFRRLLDEHRAIRSGLELRTTGCECGAKRPLSVQFGDAWHRDHMAAQLADV